MAYAVESVLESDPGHGDGTAFQRDGGIDDFDAVNRRLIDEHDHSRRWFPSQNQRQHTFGQAGGIKVWALQEAFEVRPLGQGASDGGEVETSVAKADTQVEPEEGTQVRRVRFFLTVRRSCGKYVSINRPPRAAGGSFF